MGRDIGWRWVEAIAVGASHSLSNLECQDYFLVGVIDDTSVGQILYCFVSDGAGSASRSKEGSERCCKAALEFLVDSTKDRSKDFELSESFGYALAEFAAESIQSYSEEIGVQKRDLACTFLGAIIIEGQSLFLQIGDGAIVISDDSGSLYRTVFWPDTGTYANETHFITQESYSGYLNVKLLDIQTTRLAMFTDGIQRLCLVFDAKEVYGPFFDPMFEKLENLSARGKSDELSSRLSDFLNGPQINSKTDDDKTLVLAVRF